MRSLTQFITEAKFSDSQTISYYDQIEVKKALARFLGLKYTGKFADMKKGPNIFFDGGSIYYSLGDDDHDYGLKFDKSTYGDVKAAVINMYKEHEDELKKDGWVMPTKGM